MVYKLKLKLKLKCMFRVLLLFIIIFQFTDVLFATEGSIVIKENMETVYYHHDELSRCEYPLKDGIRHGEGVCYFSYRLRTSVKAAIIPYENGKIHGTVTHFYPNGNISIIATYEHGQIIGDMISYNRNGVIESKITTKKRKWYNSTIENNMEKVVYIYHPNNVDYCIYPLKTGYILRHGVGKCFFKNGRIAEIIPYENDRKHGIAKTYYENGALMYETPFKYNRRDGYIKLYGKNGKLKKVLKRYEEYRDYELYSAFQ